MFTVIGLNEVIQLGSPVWARKYKASEASTCLMNYKKSKASTVGVRKHREDVQGPSLERRQHLEVKRRRSLWVRKKDSKCLSRILDIQVKVKMLMMKNSSV